MGCITNKEILIPASIIWQLAAGHGSMEAGMYMEEQQQLLDRSTQPINKCPLVKPFYRIKNTRERYLSDSDKQRTDGAISNAAFLSFVCGVPQ